MHFQLTSYGFPKRPRDAGGEGELEGRDETPDLACGLGPADPGPRKGEGDVAHDMLHGLTPSSGLGVRTYAFFLHNEIECYLCLAVPSLIQGSPMRRDIDIGLLRAFVAVVETGSVTGAAVLLNRVLHRAARAQVVDDRRTRMPQQKRFGEQRRYEVARNELA